MVSITALTGSNPSQPITLTTDFNTLNGLWVFSVTDTSTSQVLYYGCERLKTIPKLREMRRHMVSEMPESITLSLIAPVSTEQEGEEQVAMLKMLQTPRYDGSINTRTPRAVVCEQTGVVYKNPFQAAKDTGVNHAYLYMHLTGHQSYKKCKGLTFKYVED